MQDTSSIMDRQQLKGVLYAASAGICGSLASSFSKIGMGVDEFFSIGDRATYILLARFIMVTMTVLANVGVWIMYTRSLRFGYTTLTSTGISIASNYTFTAFTGVILFAERCSFLWVCGNFSIMIGAILMTIAC